jgi:Phosphodiester glycosidase
VLLKYRRARLIWAALLLLAGSAVWLDLDGLAVRFGGTFGIPVSRHTFWLPRAIKLGLSEPAPEAAAGPLVWTKADEGFDIAWLDVMAGGSVADGIALARIDPSRHRFAILQEPSGKKHLEDWMRDTGGVVSGPPDYQSQHGAFVVKASLGDIRDLRIDKWQDFFEHAEAGLVSYPLLLAPDGAKRTVASKWLANRSFIGVDSEGRVLIGTTQSAFFSLDRLAAFLKAAIPDLKAALNLDGGPVASQAIAVGDVRRKLHGRWELQAQNGSGRLLPISPFMTAPMPIVIAVFKRD